MTRLMFVKIQQFYVTFSVSDAKTMKGVPKMTNILNS